MLRDIYVYVDERGNSPVQEFIRCLPDKEYSKVHAYLDELLLQGHNLRRPMAAYLGEGIYELRPRDNRIFYFFYLRETVVLLHAIRKKTDRIPQGDLKVCHKRKRQVEAKEGFIEKMN